MTATEPTEVTSTALSVAGAAPMSAAADAFVKPAASTAVIKEAFDAYQQLSQALLEKSDFQQIGNREFPKKSAFRKLAVAYNVSVELVERVYERNDAGRIIRAEVVARAIAPNGRTMDGLGACDLFEKCCAAATCRNTSKWHEHCAANCDGTKHFSNPQHDLPATAATRATNRACSDLFGMGQVSAEELVGDGHQDRAPELTPSQTLAGRIADLGDEAKAELVAWCKSTKTPTNTGQMSEDQLKATNKWITDRLAAPSEKPENDPAAQPAAGTDADAESTAEPAQAAESAQTTANESAELEGDPVPETEAVNAMKPAEVKEQLFQRGLDVAGAIEILRKRLIVAMLKERLAAAQTA